MKINSLNQLNKFSLKIASEIDLEDCIFLIFFFLSIEFITNRTKVVLPTPISPYKKIISPAFIIFEI